MQPIFKESQEIGERNYLVTELTSLQGITQEKWRPAIGHLPLSIKQQRSPRPSGQGWLRRRQCV